MTLSELEEMWKVDSLINENDEMIAMEALRVGQLHSKYLGIWMQVKKQLRQAEGELLTLKRYKRIWYTGKMSEEDLTLLKWSQYLGKEVLKVSMDSVLSEDADVIKQGDKYEYLKITVGALESILKAISSRGWDIKNAIAMIRFTGGE